MIASGCAGLGYQIVWTQQSALWLGHESAAVLAVVAAFFGGVAAGSFILGARINRSTVPARWYAACEIAIGVWSIVLAFVLPAISSWLLQLAGAQPSPAWHGFVSFSGTFLLLLPATIAMGGTLPAMERLLAGMRGEGTRIAVLYAGNTCGAVLGVLLTAFWLIPRMGLMRTAAVCAALNFLCAAAALNLSSSAGHRAAASARPGQFHPMLLLGVTGLLGIGYEVLVVRVLSQVAENTVFTFAIALAVYLIGTAAGAAAYSRWHFDASQAERRCDRLLRWLALACLSSMLSLVGAETIRATILRMFGPSMTAALAAETALAIAAFALPTMVMGALFSHLSMSAHARGVSFGRALGVNTLGAAVAPLLFGVFLAPALGAKYAVLLVCGCYLALSSRRAWSSPTQWTTAAAALVIGIWAPSLAIIAIPEGGRVLSYTEGVLATVSVLEDAAGVARLHINNRQQEGSSATAFTDARQALLPILLHPSPRRALFLGLGTGVTSSAATIDPQLAVDVVELLPEVVAASRYFTGAPGIRADEPRLHVMTADARRFVRVSPARYDVIVSDNFHPARSGSGSLYTVEHFKAVRARLSEDGLFCQWLPLHQLDLETLRSIVRTFVTAYPRSWALIATNSLETPVIGLIARNDNEYLDAQQIRVRASAPELSRRLVEFGVVDEFALLGSFIAGPRSLAQFGGEAPLNTDDRPVVVYRAPRITYVPTSSASDRLVSLLQQVTISPAELLAPRAGESHSRLGAYWKARNRFIQIGRYVQPTSDVQQMLRQVREPLLAVLKISPDFRPAYDPLLLMARALAPIDPAGARALLIDLERAQPARPDAAELLRSL